MSRKAMAMGASVVVVGIGLWLSWSPRPAVPQLVKASVMPEAKRVAVAAVPLPSSESAALGLVEALLSEVDQAKRAELKQVLSNISDVAQADSLLVYLIASADEDIDEALQHSLAVMATPGLTRKLAAAYQSAPNDEAALRIAKVVEGIRNGQCLPALAEIINSPSAPLTEKLNSAALSAIARLGTNYSVKVITQCMATASAVDLPLLTKALSRVRTGGTEYELVLVAEGKRPWATSTAARVGAIQALGNYPLSLTRKALEVLSTDTDAQVAAAATGVLIALQKP